MLLAAHSQTVLPRSNVSRTVQRVPRCTRPFTHVQTPVRPARTMHIVQAAEEAATSIPAGYVEDTNFSMSKVSFGSILTPVGVSLMVYGFGAFFGLLPGTDASPLMLIYGFPMSLLGFALNYAQLKPVPCLSTPEALAMRETQCTDIQKQLREDVTRYRYGDEQHLDEALNRIFKFNTPKGIPRRLTPKLAAVREEVRDGSYSLVLVFNTSPDMTLEMWETRLDKIQTFFGPGVVAALAKTATGVDVSLTCDGSGSGRGGGNKQEVLPPLMPGLAPRVVNKAE